MLPLKEKKILTWTIPFGCKTICLIFLFHYFYPNLRLTTPVYIVLLVYRVKYHFRLSFVYSSGGLFRKTDLQWRSWPLGFKKKHFFVLFFVVCLSVWIGFILFGNSVCVSVCVCSTDLEDWLNFVLTVTGLKKTSMIFYIYHLFWGKYFLQKSQFSKQRAEENIQAATFPRKNNRSLQKNTTLIN